MVFRPFKGEVILGKISSSSAYGIKSKLSRLGYVLVFRLGDLISNLFCEIVRLDFFDDIFVPGNLLFAGSRL